MSQPASILHADNGVGGATEGDAEGLFKRRNYDYLGEFQAFLIHEEDRSERTAESYLYGLKAIQKLTGKPVHKVTTDDLRSVKRTPGYAASTKQGWVVAMKRFHAWGAMEGFWERNGMMDVTTPRPKPTRRPPVSIPTAQKILLSCETPIQFRIAYFGLYAGCRISESARMAPENWKKDRLHFMGKGGKWRSVPIHPELAKVREMIERKQPSSVAVCHSTWARFRDKHDLKNIHGEPAIPHALRKTFATEVYGEGKVAAEVVSELLGHAQTVTMGVYVEVNWSQMVAAVEPLDYWGSDPIQGALF